VAQQMSRRRLWRALLAALGSVLLGYALPMLIFQPYRLGLIAGSLAGVGIMLALFLALLLNGDGT
jgi:hypothetical protein